MLALNCWLVVGTVFSSVNRYSMAKRLQHAFEGLYPIQFFSLGGRAEEANFLKSLKEYDDIQRKYKGHELYLVGKDEKPVF